MAAMSPAVSSQMLLLNIPNFVRVETFVNPCQTYIPVYTLE